MIKRFEEIENVKNHTIPGRSTVEEKALDVAILC